MSIIVFVEDWNNQFKKASFEAVSYAKSWAELAGTTVTAVTSSGAADPAALAAFGADRILTTTLAATPFGMAQQLATITNGSAGMVIAGTSLGRSIAPALAALSGGALSTNTTDTPSSVSPVTVERGAFSSKGIETIELIGGLPMVSFVPNSVGIQERAGEGLVENLDATGTDLLRITEQSIASGKVALPEAEVVVSAGRGLKGPEHWSMIEELASVLGAATAC